MSRCPSRSFGFAPHVITIRSRPGNITGASATAFVVTLFEITWHSCASQQNNKLHIHIEAQYHCQFKFVTVNSKIVCTLCTMEVEAAQAGGLQALPSSLIHCSRALALDPELPPSLSLLHLSTCPHKRGCLSLKYPRRMQNKLIQVLHNKIITTLEVTVTQACVLLSQQLVTVQPENRCKIPELMPDTYTSQLAPAR